MHSSRGFPQHMQPGRLWSTRVLVTQAISIPRSGVVASLCISVRLRLASAEPTFVYSISHIFYPEPNVRVLVLGSEINPPG